MSVVTPEDGSLDRGNLPLDLVVTLCMPVFKIKVTKAVF